MNVFNRIVMIVLMLVLLAAAFVLTVWPQVWVIVGEQMLYLSEYARLGYVLVGILVMLVCGLLFLLEVRRPRRARYVVVDRVAGGEARVQVESVSRRLEYEVDLLQDVSDVKSHILAKGRGLRTILDVVMSADVDVPMKTEEIIETVRRVVEEQMGLRLAGKPKDAITLNIRHPKEIAPVQPRLPAVTPVAEPVPVFPEMELAGFTEEPALASAEEPQPQEQKKEEGWSETL
ncbi:MAG: alkaline shock response membrane anchor protein AmaP [Anaerolineae bacterium]